MLSNNKTRLYRITRLWLRGKNCNFFSIEQTISTVYFSYQLISAEMSQHWVERGWMAKNKNKEKLFSITFPSLSDFGPRTTAITNTNVKFIGSWTKTSSRCLRNASNVVQCFWSFCTIIESTEWHVRIFPHVMIFWVILRWAKLFSSTQHHLRRTSRNCIIF